MKSRKRSNKVQPFLCSLRWLPIRSITVVQDFDPVLQCFHRLHLIQLLTVHTTFRHRHSSWDTRTFCMHACIYIYIYIYIYILTGHQTATIGRESIYIYKHSFHENEIIRSGIFYPFRPNSEELFTLQRCAALILLQFSTLFSIQNRHVQVRLFLVSFAMHAAVHQQDFEVGYSGRRNRGSLYREPKSFQQFSLLKPGVGQIIAKQDFDLTNLCIPVSKHSPSPLMNYKCRNH